MRGKRAAIAAAFAGIAVMGVAAFSCRKLAVEQWYLWRLHRCQAPERREILEALVGLKSPRAVPFLLYQIGLNSDQKVSIDEHTLSGWEHASWPIGLLMKMDLAAVPPLVEEARAPDPGVRFWSLIAISLIDFDSPEVYATVRDLTSDADGWVRMAARTAAAKMAILDHLRGEDWSSRQSAALSLCFSGTFPRGALRTFLIALQDPDPLVREGVMRTLPNMGPEAMAAIPFLEKTAKSPVHGLARTAETALQRLRLSEVEPKPSSQP